MHLRKTGTTVAGGLALLLSSLLSLAAVASPPAAAAREIDHLLDRVLQSGCEFNRNGSWYQGDKVQAHLRDKYDWLVKRDLIGVTTDFIDKAATRSSMTGLAYRVRCVGQEEVTSKQWFHGELQRYRAAVH